jgi:hypothetical protein
MSPEYGVIMASKLPRPKITVMSTSVGHEVFSSTAGPAVWGNVEIRYASEGVEPTLNIKVPIPIVANQTDAQRRGEALRRARKLIDHACAAIEFQPALDLPEIIEGIAEELGVLPPTTQPKRSRRA